MRRFFRFSIRDLLWLTLVVAMGLGWFVQVNQLHFEASALETRCHHAEELLRKSGEVIDLLRANLEATIVNSGRAFERLPPHQTDPLPR